jgi:hypothetical protein
MCRASKLALVIARRAENAVVFSLQAVVLLQPHSRHRHALNQIETVASVGALSGFPHQHRPVPLLQLASLLRRPAPSACGQGPLPLPAWNALPSQRGRSEDDHSAIPIAGDTVRGHRAVTTDLNLFPHAIDVVIKLILAHQPSRVRYDPVRS